MNANRSILSLGQTHAEPMVQRKRWRARATLVTLLTMSLLGVQQLLGYTVPFSESFENGWAQGALVNTASSNWTSTSDDLSYVTNLTYTYATNLPIATTHTNIVRLDTEGAALSNTFTSAIVGSQTNRYIDAMMRFENQCDSLPTNPDAANKGALFVNTSSNLVVYHGLVDSSGTWTNTVMEAITNVTMTTDKWYRVSVAFVPVVKAGGVATQEAFQVRIDGALVTNSQTDAYNEGWQANWANNGAMSSASANGTWFMSASTLKNQKLSGVSFMGTGYLDDLQVLTNNPIGNAITITAGAQSTAYGTPLALGTTSFTVTGAMLGSEQITSVILTANTNGAPNVGAYTITPSSATGSGGFDAAKYNITYVTNALTVGQKTLTVSATGIDRGYDGTTNATVTLHDNRVSGDALTVSYTAAYFADKAVGTGKPVSVLGISMTGCAAANYTLGNTTASTTANITAAPLTITATAQNKGYGATLSSAAGYTQFTSAGLTNSETIPSVTVAYTNGGALATNAVGTYANSISLSSAISGGLIQSRQLRDHVRACHADGDVPCVDDHCDAAEQELRRGSERRGGLHAVHVFGADEQRVDRLGDRGLQ